MAKQNARPPNRLHKAGFYAANALSGVLPWAWWSQQRDRLMSELESLTPSIRAHIMPGFVTTTVYTKPSHRRPMPSPSARFHRAIKAVPITLIFVT